MEIRKDDVLRLSRQPTHLDIQVLSWPEVHDVYVEVIVCSLGQQLAQHKDLRGYVHRGLLAGTTNLHLWLAPLQTKMKVSAFTQPTRLKGVLFAVGQCRDHD